MDNVRVVFFVNKLDPLSSGSDDYHVRMFIRNLFRDLVVAQGVRFELAVTVLLPAWLLENWFTGGDIRVTSHSSSIRGNDTRPIPKEAF